VKRRTPWITVQMQVAFEESEMEVLVRDSRIGEARREKREILMPVFRLPDGTEFNGRRAGEMLRARIIRAAGETDRKKNT